MSAGSEGAGEIDPMAAAVMEEIGLPITGFRKKLTAEMINDGDSIILDSGTTTHQIARQIKHKKDLKVITNGLNIAMELFGADDIQLIFLGGVIRQNSLSSVGHFA